MAVANLKFADLVDVASLQTLMDGLCELIGIANAVIDTDGVVITHSGWQEACALYHRVDPRTRGNCLDSDTVLAASLLKGEAFAIYACLNGLVDCAMPIIVDGYHVANIFTGQCFTEPPDSDYFRERAQNLKFDEEAYLRAIAKIPVVPRERLEKITRMYADLAQILGAYGLDRLRQRQTAEELVTLSQRLAEKVEERTLELHERNSQLQREKQALTDSEARLQALFENMSSGVAVYLPIDAEASDFVFLAFNKAAEAIDKIQRDQVIGRPLSQVFPGAAEFGLAAVLRRVAATGRAEAFPSAHYRDGRVDGWRDNYVYQLPSGELVAIYDDVTELRERETVRQELDARFRSTFDAAAIGMALVLPDGRFMQVNAALCKIVGYSEAELLGLTFQDITHPDDLQTDLSQVQALLDGDGTGYQMEKRYFHKDGRLIWILLSVSAVRDGEDRILYFVSQVQDITDRRHLLEQLERQAHLDYLTGIPNRRYFMEQAELELARVQRYGNHLSVLMLDIDRFKVINDTYGHAIGDRVLQKMGQIFIETLREIDIPGRLGGEEFAVLLPETGLQKAVEVADRLRVIVAASKIALASGLPLRFTVSIGIATLRESSVNIDTLLNLADQALYQAKQTGRNKVCCLEE
ncbi:diguanylate cyclase [Methylococcaceae bacterium WWC4]|nr:diguanylate cyclase [Methylococcaceae bacterium WWC4]